MFVGDESAKLRLQREAAKLYPSCGRDPKLSMLNEGITVALGMLASIRRTSARCCEPLNACSAASRRTT